MASVFNTFTPTAKDGLVDTIKKKITIGKLIGDSDGTGTVGEVDTVVSAWSMGDFTGIYAPFATAANWTNNIMTANAPTGNLNGDLHFGTFENGAYGYVEYTQGGWLRNYVNPYIQTSTSLGALIRAVLVTSANWTSSGIYTITTAGYGDVGQCYQEGIYYYLCIANTASNVHTWARFEVNLGTDVVISDVSFIPYPVTAIVSNGSTYAIPAKSIIKNIAVLTNDTLGGNLSIGSTVGGSDIVNTIALSASAGVYKPSINYTQLDTIFSSSTTTNINITLSTATSVTLYLLIQKVVA